MAWLLVVIQVGLECLGLDDVLVIVFVLVVRIDLDRLSSLNKGIAQSNSAVVPQSRDIATHPLNDIPFDGIHLPPKRVAVNDDLF